MKKFDTLLDQYLKEADASPTLTGMVGSVTNPIVNTIRRGQPTLSVSYKPQNVYYLFKGSKNIPALRGKLNSLANQKPPQVTVPALPPPPGTPPPPAGTPPPLPQQKDADIFDNSGKITNKPGFAILLLNALDDAMPSRNYITIDELINKQVQSTNKEGQPRDTTKDVASKLNLPKEKIHAEIMKFINENQLKDLIKYATPDQAKEMDKGGFLKRVGTGFDSLAGQTINSLQGTTNML
jgi:hypothetical protein